MTEDPYQEDQFQDLTQVPHADDLPTYVPEGEYELRVIGLSKAYSKQDNKPAIKVQLEINAEQCPKGMPVPVFNWCGLQSQYTRLLANSLDFLDALGVERTRLNENLRDQLSDEELNLYLKDFIGRTITCYLTVQEDDTYGKQNRIARVIS